MNFTHVLLVGVGGFLGSIARYAAVFFIDKKLHGLIPFGTLAVNVTGSFVLGFILGFLGSRLEGDTWRLLMATGFCGGFTTFSAFAFENLSLIQQRLPGPAFLYIAISVVGGLLAVWSGYSAARYFT